MPEEISSALDRLCTGLPDTRWTGSDDFHLTLRFIGDVDHAAFYDIGELLTGIMLPPFDLQLVGLGQFPPRGPLRQLWAGVAPSPDLDRLRRRIDACILEAGVPRDGRKYIPHVTLARFRAPPPEPRLAAYLLRNALFRSSPFPVSSFGLYSSLLRSDGAEHTLEAEYDFVTGAMFRH
jgi:RNA 2',3'-cyclic 3'-phosphodiesterase